MRVRMCAVCQTVPVPDGSRGETCSFSCRARLRELRKTKEWRLPKQYAPELVERVRHLYIDEGMTITEVQAAVGRGVKVQRLMENHDIPRRRRIKRDQYGDKNDSWRGDDATYAAVHMRLLTTYGSASLYDCVDCGGRASDWAYDLTCPNEREDQRRGCLYTTDLSHYSPRCVPCHQRQDRERTPLGQFARKQVRP